MSVQVLETGRVIVVQVSRSNEYPPTLVPGRTATHLLLPGLNSQAVDPVPPFGIALFAQLVPSLLQDTIFCARAVTANLPPYAVPSKLNDATEFVLSSEIVDTVIVISLVGVAPPRLAPDRVISSPI